MTLQSLPLPIPYPGLCTAANSAPGLSGGTTLDAAGEYYSWVFTAQEDMLISHVGLKTSAAAGSPTADVRIETVDAATGVPTGTLWAPNTNIVTAALTTTFALHALTAAATIAKGEKYAIKVLYNSGTSFAFTALSALVFGMGMPYAVTNVTGSAAKGAMTGFDVAVGSSTSVFYPLRQFFPAASIAANAFNNTGGARRGVRFQVPFKCQVNGFRMYVGTAVGDFSAALFDDAGAELSSSATAFEGDQTAAAASGGTCEFHFDNPVTLSPGVWYRLAIEPASATNCNMYTATLPSANYRSAWPGGTNFHYTTYTSGGGWVDTATDQVPFMDVLLKQLDDGVSAGGAHVIGG